MDRLIKSDRIETLKNRMLSVPRFASIEQARIITDTYKEHEDEPRIMQRAYSLKNCLEKINISVEPEELIGKTLLAITNLPPRKMMGIESCGMIISATHLVEGREGLNVLMLDDKIPAGAKLY